MVLNATEANVVLALMDLGLRASGSQVFQSGASPVVQTAMAKLTQIVQEEQAARQQQAAQPQPGQQPQSDFDWDVEDKPNGQDVPPKRKRGRPRKARPTA